MAPERYHQDPGEITTGSPTRMLLAQHGLGAARMKHR
jgi:hypothetical protein